MRTLIAAVGIATALAVGAGQAVAAPLSLVDAPAVPVAQTGSSSGSARFPWDVIAFLSCMLPPSPGCTAGGGDVS
ncbi:hypothetical protein ACFYUD_00685 [Nocardia tengchongensis]|uniref:hypothetical protein n=1 Tax=Nocardia tengchongensis TaxID=2055889 RepID=UPI0036956350